MRRNTWGRKCTAPGCIRLPFILNRTAKEDDLPAVLQNSNKRTWTGGSESYMFNRLEEIIIKPKPRTPALKCGMTAALNYDQIGDSVRLLEIQSHLLVPVYRCLHRHVSMYCCST